MFRCRGLILLRGTLVTERRVESSEAGARLDATLSQWLGVSRSALAKLWDSAQVRVNGQKAQRSRVLSEGDRVAFTSVAPKELEATAEDASLPVIYRDDDVVVVDKPAGMAAHTAPGYDGATVVGALLGMGIDPHTTGDQYRRGIVHRLDADTSGLMVVALNERSYQDLIGQFKARTVEKTYLTVAQGHLAEELGRIEAPIGRARKGGKMAVRPDGRPATTIYEVERRLRGADLLRVQLLTGRTHQIRVHLAWMRHPCVGDALYGADPTLVPNLRRQWLHAATLSFESGGQRMTFESPIPADLATALAALEATDEGWGGGGW